MRAVRARLAALTAGLAAFLVAALPLSPAGFADFLTVGAGFFAVCVVFWAVFCAGFFAVCASFFFAVEDACPAGLVFDLPEDCPATGDTINKNESKPAKKQVVSLETEVGKDETLISSL